MLTGAQSMHDAISRLSLPERARKAKNLRKEKLQMLFKLEIINTTKKFEIIVRRLDNDEEVTRSSWHGKRFAYNNKTYAVYGPTTISFSAWLKTFTDTMKQKIPNETFQVFELVPVSKEY